MSGTIGNAIIGQTPQFKVNVLHFHGTADSQVRYEDAGFNSGIGYYPVGMGAEQTVEVWRNWNSCQQEPVITYFPDIKDDGKTFERYLYVNENDNIFTAFIKVIGGDHEWYYYPQNDIDYTLEIYKFFTRIMDFPTAADTKLNDLISIFPNPAKEKLFVNTDVDEIEIIDVFGKIIEKLDDSNLNFIDISNLNAGMYFVKLKKENEIYLKKLIVK